MVVSLSFAEGDVHVLGDLVEKGLDCERKQKLLLQQVSLHSAPRAISTDYCLRFETETLLSSWRAHDSRGNLSAAQSFELSMAKETFSQTATTPVGGMICESLIRNGFVVFWNLPHTTCLSNRWFEVVPKYPNATYSWTSHARTIPWFLPPQEPINGSRLLAARQLIDSKNPHFLQPPAD